MPQLAWTTLFSLALFTGCVQSADDFESSALAECDEAMAAPESVRFVSYNIRSGTSSSVEQVGDEIENLQPDIVALQEVNKGVSSRGGDDQARMLADQLGFHFVYAAASEKEDGTAGVALLTRFPIQSAERHDLKGNLAREPRVAIDAQVCTGGASPTRVVATHTDLLPWSATDAAKDIAENVLRGDVDATFVMGDLNSLPGWEAVKTLLSRGFVDVIGQVAEGSTYIRDFLPRRLDYILASDDIAPRVTDAGIHHEEGGEASDHLPIYVDVSYASDE